MNAILATDAGVGFDIFDLSTVKNSQDKGNQTSSKNSATAIDGQKATCWSSFSTKTGSFYLTDVGTSTITEISVDKSLKGKIIKVSFDVRQMMVARASCLCSSNSLKRTTPRLSTTTSPPSASKSKLLPSCILYNESTNRVLVASFTLWLQGQALSTSYN